MRPQSWNARSMAAAVPAPVRLALAAALVAAAPVAAQDYRFGAGWNAGGAWFSPLNAGAVAAGGGAASDLTFDPGWIVGLQFEQWFGSGRLGLRLNGALTERPFTAPAEKRDISLWLADADVLLRLLPAEGVIGVRRIR